MIEKIPPQNIETEEALLNILIHSQDKFFDINLEKEDFYLNKNKVLFEVIKSLILKKTKIDILSIKNELGKEEFEILGGYTYISKLMHDYKSELNIKKYEKIIKSLSIRRKIINAQIENENSLYDENEEIEKVIARVQTNIFKNSLLKNEKDDIEEIEKELSNVQKEYSLKYENGEKYIGTATGFDKIDNVIDGIRDSHVWTIGAWTSTGKTQFVLNIANSILEQEKPLSIISLEMSKVDILARLIGIRHNMSSMLILKGFRTPDVQEKIKEAKEFYRQSKLKIHNSFFELEKIKMLIRKENYISNTKIFIIDYIQNILGGGTKEYDLITKIAVDLQAIARELKISIIMVSQISNDSEKGNGAGGGFKGSGAIEAVSDLAIKLKRNRSEETPEQFAVPVEINIIKNRHGFTGIIKDYEMILKSGKFNLINNKTYENENNYYWKQ